MRALLYQSIDTFLFRATAAISAADTGSGVIFVVVVVVIDVLASCFQ